MKQLMNFRIEPEDKRRLEEVAQKERRSQSNVICFALSQYFAEGEKTK